jgi:hypothetical protein
VAVGRSRRGTTTERRRQPDMVNIRYYFSLIVIVNVRTQKGKNGLRRNTQRHQPRARERKKTNDDTFAIYRREARILNNGMDK